MNKWVDINDYILKSDVKEIVEVYEQGLPCYGVTKDGQMWSEGFVIKFGYDMWKAIKTVAERVK